LVGCDKESNDRCGDQYGEKSNIDEKKEEEPMIAFSYAVSNPGTVMVKFGNTNVATVAVFRTWRSENIAG
jgi:hypothetical protein